MNYSALVLVLIGLGILVVGFTGSQNALCQAIFGGKCSWLPGRESTTQTGTGTVPGHGNTGIVSNGFNNNINTITPGNYSSSWIAL